MARDVARRFEAAADAVLVDGERVTATGRCWATERRGRVPLLLLARRAYMMALTDRRLLVFERTRRPAPRDLVMGKRYESFTLEQVKRRRPLMQVQLHAANGTRMIFEFRRRQRDIGGQLVARLTPRPAGEADPVPSALAARFWGRTT